MLDTERIEKYNQYVKASEGVKEVFSMKSTGMIRQLDSLGRIVLPIELRRTLDIQTKDMLEIYV